MKPIVFVHGMATDGGTLYEWGKRFEAAGREVRYYHYEKRHFWSYWRKSNLLADAGSFLHSSVYEDGCHVVCHSMGQLIVQEAARMGAIFDTVSIYSGAGTSDKFVWPEQSMKECHWFVNASDMAVWFGALIPRHPFGKAARRGYVGVRDRRHINHKFNRDKWFNIDHSFWFTDWAERMFHKQMAIWRSRGV